MYRQDDYKARALALAREALRYLLFARARFSFMPIPVFIPGLVLGVALVLSGCAGGGNRITLRSVSPDDRIDLYQLPRGTHVPSVTSGTIPGDSDIVGSALRSARASAPQPSSLTADQQGSASSGKQRTHKVGKGDTLSSISRTYGVTLQFLLSQNSLSNPNNLRVGQILIVGGGGGGGDFVAGERRHIVKKGETLYSIARKYGSSVSRLSKDNRVSRADKLNIGQLLIVNKASGSNASSSAKSSSQTSSKTSGSVNRASGVSKLSSAPKRARKDFLRPVDGRVIRRFGERSYGQRNNGIDIAAKVGLAVRASENGVVVYSGSALKGFGNLILVRHADGYLSAYGYNRKNLVARGDKVKRGQKIAEVGMSGDAKKSMLHFELRQNSRPLDPQKYFAKG